MIFMWTHRVLVFRILSILVSLDIFIVHYFPAIQHSNFSDTLRYFLTNPTSQFFSFRVELFLTDVSNCDAALLLKREITKIGASKKNYQKNSNTSWILCFIIIIHIINMLNRNFVFDRKFDLPNLCFLTQLYLFFVQLIEYSLTNLYRM